MNCTNCVRAVGMRGKVCQEFQGLRVEDLNASMTSDPQLSRRVLAQCNGVKTPKPKPVGCTECPPDTSLVSAQALARCCPEACWSAVQSGVDPICRQAAHMAKAHELASSETVESAP